MLTQLGLIVLLAIVNGFFSLSEMAMVASRKSRLKQMARHSGRARAALRLAHRPELFLSTVQIGITLTMLVAGAVTGASLRDSIVHVLGSIGLPWLIPHAVVIGSLVGFVLATFIQIVVGELVPKRIALVAPERLATNVAMPMLFMARVCMPFVWILNACSTGLLRLLRFEHTPREAVSEEEIRTLVAESAEQGVLDADERNMVSRVLRLGDRNVGSVMTPRTRIAWLDVDAPLEDNLEVLRSTSYSCYPVYRGDESEIVGVVQIKRMVDGLLQGKPDLFGNLTKPIYVPATLRALDLLDTFSDTRIRIALVVDEYGDIDGLISLNDLLATVIGQSGQSRDDTSGLWRKRGKSHWVVDGSMPVDDLRELLHLDHLPNEDEYEFHTLGGMILTALGHIPQKGEAINWQGMRFEVTRLDGARIDKVNVSPAHSTAESTQVAP